jgi:hypothetical protein
MPFVHAMLWSKRMEKTLQYKAISRQGGTASRLGSQHKITFGWHGDLSPQDFFGQ